jgi:hypothetical protein
MSYRSKIATVLGYINDVSNSNALLRVVSLHVHALHVRLLHKALLHVRSAA